MKSLFKKRILIIGFVFSLFLTAGYGVKNVSADLPEMFNIGTVSVGTATHAIDLATSHILSEYLKKSVKVIPFTKEGAKYEALRKGEVLFVNTSILAADSAMKGIHDFSDPSWIPIQFRLIQHGIKFSNVMAVRGDSKITKLSELKGKRIGHVPGWPSSGVQGTAMLDFAGISKDKVTWIPFPSYIKTIEGLMAGICDATVVSTVSPKVVEAYSSPVGIRFLEMPEKDKEGWRRFNQHVVYTHGIWPYGINKDKPIECAIGNYFRVVLPEQSEKVVYSLVKALFETFPQYRDSNPPFSEFFSLEETLNLKTWKPVEVPYHPGFIKFAKEKGFWTAAHEEYQKNAEGAEKVRGTRKN